MDQEPPNSGPAAPAPTCALTQEQMAQMTVKPRTFLLAPVLPTKSLSMLYAPTGYGKSLVAMAIGHTVATGGTLFGTWRAPAAKRVLYIDGEMDDVEMDWRVKSLQPYTPNFRIISPDYIRTPIPDLTKHEGRAFVERELGVDTNKPPDGRDPATDFLILDNLSTLFNMQSENEAQAWSLAQHWMVELRRRRVAVMFVHHTGKSGDQRGSSKKLDVLNLTLSLKRPPDYEDGDGCRVVVTPVKGRHLHGEAAKPFEVKFGLTDGRATWALGKKVDSRLVTVMEFKRKGMTVRQIAEATGWSKSLVQKLIAKAGGTDDGDKWE